MTPATSEWGGDLQADEEDSGGDAATAAIEGAVGGWSCRFCSGRSRGGAPGMTEIMNRFGDLKSPNDVTGRVTLRPGLRQPGLQQPGTTAARALEPGARRCPRPYAELVKMRLVWYAGC